MYDKYERLYNRGNYKLINKVKRPLLTRTIAKSSMVKSTDPLLHSSLHSSYAACTCTVPCASGNSGCQLE